MSNLDQISLGDKLRQKIDHGHKIISAYLTLGYPDLETSITAMVAVAEAGADIIEIGIPFSDPMADGQTIQYTNQVVLDSGFNAKEALTQALSRLASVDVAVVVMTYANVVYNFPLTSFKTICHSSSVDGIIIPDLPPEHAAGVVDLRPIYLIAPNTSVERLSSIIEHTFGFVYVVSKLGITGGNYDSDQRLKKLYTHLDLIQSHVPRLQGFGIDSVDAARNAISMGADGVIIGSKLLRLLGDDGDVEAVANFIAQIRKGLDTH